LRRALVTGASGFVGTYLTAHLKSFGWNVAGYDWRMSGQIPPSFIGDIYRGDGLSLALNEFQPDVIFHLAGILKSEKPETFYNVHVLGTLALFEAVTKSGLHPRVVVAGSSAVYGAGAGAKPITESFQPRPVTHYATSKLAQEMVALRYFTAFGLPVICVRTFNLLGPGLSPDMALSTFAKQIAQAENTGKPAKIFTGDLTTQRDYLDIRDAIHAYALLAEHGKAGQIYNVCSGQVFSIQEGLQVLLNQAKIPIEVVLDPARMQKQDVPVQIGSAKKIHQLTGWKSKIQIKQSVLDLLNDWREKINAENNL